MGQTLTHGIYLPDEGERNCYNGLAANWSILDGAVGTIAEHTSALAGKAPLVHTHGKADITDFPALANVATSGSYNDLSNIPASFTPASHTHGNITNDGKVGTTANLPLITGTDGVVQAGSFGTLANTFCEGNDSRLSDARTPVAHTHVTADVTDLLNTAHEWTKEQVCDEGFTAKSTTIERCVTPDTVKHVNFIFKDKNNKGFGAIRRYFRNSGDQQIQIFGNTKIKDGQYDETGSDVFFGFSEVLKPDGTMYFSFDGYLNNSIRPRLTNTYQLGDSSYQWQSVYAQSYYYNGTAWGLDKANEWTGENTFSAANLFRKRAFTLGDNSSQIVRMEYKDTNNSRWGILSFIQDTNNTVHCDIGVHALKTDGQTVLNKSVTLLVKPDNSSEFKPINDKAIDLGTSTNKWKTLNGLNPGALSLPNLTSNGYINLSDNISANTEYSYTPPADGWLALYVLTTGFHVENAVGIFNGSGSGNAHRLACSATSGINLARSSYYHGAVLLPVIAGIPYLCWIKIDSSTTLASKVLYFYKAAGNV